MPFDVEPIVSAVAEARAKGTERDIKFEQSFDLAVNFRKRELDVSRPENRLNQEIVLPNPLYPPARICVFGDGEFAEKAREAGVDMVVSKEEIPKVGEDKKARKTLAKSYDFFIASTDTMPLVGRYLGQALGPRGKMPRPLPPQADIRPLVEQYQKTIRIRMRNTPTFHVKVGHVRMGDRQVAENIAAVLNFLENKGLSDRIDSVFVKLTMGPAVRVPLRR